jgi:hypothetical protein
VLDRTSVPFPPAAVAVEFSPAHAVAHPLGSLELVSNRVAVSIAP